MRCAKAGKALALHVGHELDASGSRKISAHLARCERCRTLEVEMRDSRAWLESAPAPPLDESDYSTVRRGVWQRIEDEGGIARQRTARAGRLVLAGGLLAGALLAVVFFLRPRFEALRPAAQKMASSPLTVPTLEPLPLTRSPREPASVGAILTAPRARVRPAAPAARPGVTRIEFQTANPGVRIIWLVKEGDGVPSSAAGRNQEVS